MIEAVSLDSKTLLIKADKESDLSEVIDFLSKKDKCESIDAFLDFASRNAVIEKGYKFSREECHDR
jgi:hypothetical protein